MIKLISVKFSIFFDIGERKNEILDPMPIPGSNKIRIESDIQEFEKKNNMK